MYYNISLLKTFSKTSRQKAENDLQFFINPKVHLVIKFFYRIMNT